MDDDLKCLVVCLCLVSLLVIGCVAINVGTNYNCKVQAIAAGMKSQEVQEACK